MLMALFLMLCVLQAADVIITVQILQRGGREANPVMSWVIKRLGVHPGLILPKVVAMLGIGLYGLNWVLLTLLCALYAWVVLHNCRVIRRIRASPGCKTIQAACSRTAP